MMFVEVPNGSITVAKLPNETAYKVTIEDGTGNAVIVQKVRAEDMEAVAREVITQSNDDANTLAGTKR